MVPSPSLKRHSNASKYKSRYSESKGERRKRKVSKRKEFHYPPRVVKFQNLFVELISFFLFGFIRDYQLPNVPVFCFFLLVPSIMLFIAAHPDRQRFMAQEEPESAGAFG